DPSTTTPDRNLSDGTLVYRNGARNIPPFKVLHVAGFGFNGLKGYSVAKYHGEAVGMSLAAERAGGSFFGHGARPSG
ncbi:phage portal protein, partial [Lacticaseibacillus paracasei]